MTAYWVTIALVGYLMWMAKLSEPAMNERQMGTLPTKPLARILVLSAALVLMIVAALRWKVGTDYGQYVINYDSYKLSFFSDLRTFNEPGIRGIAWLVSQVADNSTVFMAAVSLFTLRLMLFTILATALPSR
ncbi:MAG: EpsG family protein [Nocardioidaceae bacterium]